MRIGRALAVIALAGAFVRLGVACFIDLEPPAGPIDDASADRGFDIDATLDGGEGGADGGIIECTRNEDCVADGSGASCLTPRCTAGRCIFDLCVGEGGCPVSRCDLEGGAGVCTEAVDPGFLAGSFSVSITQRLTDIACATLGRCVAVAYPFVFVVDGADSVSGYLVADPTDKTPRRVPVDKLGVGPVALVASGSRIFFADRPQGTGDLTLTLGWFDVPGNPYAASIPVNRVTVPYKTTNTSIPGLMPAPDNGIYLTLGTTTFLFRPPIASGTEVRYVTPNPDPQIPFSLVAPAGPDIAAISIDASTGGTAFALLKNSGVSGALFSPRAGTNTTSAIGQLANAQVSVAGGARGEVIASAGVGTLVDGSVPQVQKARLVWIVEAKSGVVTADGDAGVDLMTYAPPFGAGARVTTAPAAIDGGAVALYVNQLRDASIAQVVNRDDGTGVPAADPARTAILPGGAPQAYVLQSSAAGDWVYAFSLAPSGLVVDVHILRPACQAQ